MEAFISDTGMSESECDTFMPFGQARRDRRLFMQIVTYSKIKVCETVMFEDEHIHSYIETRRASS